MNTSKIKSLRLQSNLTQEALAELLGVEQRQISRWENGKNTPPADMVARFALALNTSADFLLDLTDDPTPPHRSEGLTEREQRIIEALRRGETVEAIKMIVGVAGVG